MHLAAKVDVVGPWADYQRANVDGTRRSSTACRAAGVGRLVHVSSPSVAHAGLGAGRGAAPARPTRDRARGHYARSKAVAERLALARGRSGPGRRRDPPAPGVGARATPSWSRGWWSGPAPAGCPLVGSGAALIDTHLRRQRGRRRCVAAARPLRARRAARRWWCPTASRVRSPRSSPRLCRAAGRPRPARPRAVRLARAAGAAVDAVWAAGWTGSGRRAGRPAADPVPGRAAGHGALVRPAAHPRGAALEPAGEPRRGASPRSPARSPASAASAPADRAGARPVWAAPGAGARCAVPAPGPDLWRHSRRARVGA